MFLKERKKNTQKKTNNGIIIVFHHIFAHDKIFSVNFNKSDMNMKPWPEKFVPAHVIPRKFLPFPAPPSQNWTPPTNVVKVVSESESGCDIFCAEIYPASK